MVPYSAVWSRARRCKPQLFGIGLGVQGPVVCSRAVRCKPRPFAVGLGGAIPGCINLT